jgi:hypothetical protein
MTQAEFILELSKEGRAWAAMLHLPALSAVVFWHLPQPKWVKAVLERFRGPKA